MFPGTYVVYVCDMLFTLLSLDRVRILAVYGGVGGVRELSEFIKYILIFLFRSSYEGLAGLEQHEGEWWQNFHFNS